MIHSIKIFPCLRRHSWNEFFHQRQRRIPKLLFPSQRTRTIKSWGTRPCIRLHHSSSSPTFYLFFKFQVSTRWPGEGRCLLGLFRCSRRHRRCRVIDSSPTMRGTAISQRKKHTKTNSPLFGRRRRRRRKTYCTAFTSGTHSYSFIDVINNLQCYLTRWDSSMWPFFNKLCSFLFCFLRETVQLCLKTNSLFVQLCIFNL